jgi:hypothetical protein
MPIQVALSSIAALALPVSSGIDLVTVGCLSLCVRVQGVNRRLTVNGEETPYYDAVRWAGLTIFVDLPVTVVPVGRTSKNLPVGVQIVAAAWQDLTAIEVGKMLERVGCAYVPPPMAVDEAASL